MLGLLADVNADGYLNAILTICSSARWRGVWESLDVHILTFAELSLDPAAPDDVVWQVCQRQGVMLFTDNRNSDRSDSLQAAILAHNTSASFPVLTHGDSQRLFLDREYAERAAIRLMEIVMEPDRYRGSGRLFLPAHM